MKNVFKVLGIIALVALIGFSFIACDDGGGGGSSGGGKTLSGISVTNQPTKTTYNIGDTLNTAGMVVTATYSDGTKAAVTDYTLSAFDSTTAGEKIITVTYQGKTDTFKVTVTNLAVTLTGLEISSQPTKTQYYIGDTINTAGLEVKAKYSDNSSIVVTTYTLSGFDSATAGEKTVTVTYEGKTATFTVTIIVRQIVAKPTANPAGGTLVASGTTVTLTTATDGAEIWYTTNNSVPAKGGTAAGSTKYTAPFAITPPVTVKAVAFKDEWTNSDTLEAVYPATGITVADISITAPANGAIPTTTVTGQEQERFTSGAVTWSPSVATFLASTQYTATVTLTAKAGFTFTGIANANVKVGEASATTVSVASDGKTLTLTYKFPATTTKVVKSVAITGQPTKLTYTHGDALNLAGLIVTLTYDDNTTAAIAAANFSANSITAAPANGIPLESGTYNNTAVQITYGNFEALFTNKLTVNKGNASTFTVEPASIPAQTYDGTEKTVTITLTYPVTSGTARKLTLGNDYTVAYTNNTNAGTATLTITGTGDYTGTKAVTFTINKANPVTTWPTAKSITYGQALSDSEWVGGQHEAGVLAWENPSTKPDVGTHTYKVTFTPASTTNYNTVTKNDMSITVEAAPISTANISITAPTNGATPATTSATTAERFTIGTITWSQNGTPVTGSFLGSTVYTATVTLTAKTGYTFTGLESGVTVDGEAATITGNTGATLTLTYTFAATSAKVVSGISVTGPTNLTYTHGDVLDLAGLTVTLNYNDSTSDTITENFTASGITATPADGTPLERHEYNGRPVTITYGSFTQTTGNLTINAKSVSGLTVDPIDARDYTGADIEPSVTVKHAVESGTTRTLEEGADKDYTLSYSNNHNAGTATITITGKNDYTGTQNVTFTINRKSIMDSDVTIQGGTTTKTYTGSPLTQDISILFSSGALTLDTDYTVDYKDSEDKVSNINAGQATVTIAGAGNFTGSTTVHFTIDKANPVITTWPSASSIVSGNKLSTSSLSGDVHATPGSFAWTNPDEVPAFGPSNHSVTFTPTDTANYNTATQNVSITVTEAHITAATITITAPATGAAPSSTASNLSQERFDSGTVAWFTGSNTDTPFSGNQFLGTSVYTATVTLSAHTGFTFTGINNASVTINGSAATVVSNQGSTLNLSYTFAQTGSKTVSSFTITTQPSNLSYTHGDALDLTGLTVTLTYNDSSNDVVAAADFGTHSVTAAPSAGSRLDHSVYDGKPVAISVGGITHNTNNLTVAKGNASTFTIDPETFTAHTYTGAPITEEFKVYYPVSGGGTPRELVLNDDYTVSYNNTNVNVGNATLTITAAANSDYTGNIVFSNIFAITALNIGTSNRISIDPIADQPWTGSAITPASIIVRNNSVPMTITSEYTVQVTNNTNRGIGLVTITAAGNNYTGTKTANFNIVAKDISETADVDIKINTDGDDLVITVKDGSTTLASGTDYDATYTFDADDPFDVTITFKGNYAGTKIIEGIDVSELDEVQQQQSAPVQQNKMSLPSGSKTSGSSWK